MSKRIVAILMAAWMLVSVLSGCGDKEEGKEEASNLGSSAAAEESTRGKYAYKAEYIPLTLDSEGRLEHINSFCVSDQTVFFYGDFYVGEEPWVDEFTNESYMSAVYETRLFSMDLTTRQVSPMKAFEFSSVPEGHEGQSYINQLQPDGQGGVWVVEQINSYYFDLPADFNAETDDPYMYYTQGVNQTVLHQLTATGEKKKSIELQCPQDSYLSTILITENGTAIASDWQNIYYFDESGVPAWSISIEFGINNLYNMGNGEIAAWIWKDDGSYLTYLDMENHAFGEEIKLNPNAYSLYPTSDNFDYVYDFNGTFFGHTVETGESEKLFSWLDCDVNSNNLYGMSILMEDGRVLTMESEYDKSAQKTNYSLVMMQPVDPSEIPVKQELTLACFYLDWDIRSDIVNFNKSHDDVRIVVKEYSQYATEENHLAGLQKLNTEMMSGMVPDLFLFSMEMPVAQYAAKGFLADLWPMIDSDPELSREDLMTHFFDVLSNDGKLYQIVDRFAISTVVGKEATVGSGSSWTMNDLMNALEQQPEGTTIFGRYDNKDSILTNCVCRSADSFIDWETQQCSFDGQEFIDLLKFANQFPMESSDTEIYKELVEPIDMESEASLLRSGKQMLYRTNLDSFSSLQWAYHVFGEKANFIGYPTTSDNGSCFEISSSLAISSVCKNTEVAWSFIRYYLTEEHQTQEYMYEFPTNKHSFETLVERSMEVEYMTDGETGEEVPAPVMSIWYGDNDELLLYSLSQEEADAFMEIYENCTSIYSYDQEVSQLISEDAQPFFDGQKTAEETARLIQDRVSLYVMENS